MIVKVISINRYKDWILSRHYAKRMPWVFYAFGLFGDDGSIQGICTYGPPVSRQIRFCCGETYKEHTIELNRVIKNDGLPPNTQSWFIARTFELLPKPMVIISYADPNYNHIGYTYQALNFLYTGTGGGLEEFWFKGKSYTKRHTYKFFERNLGLPYDTSVTFVENFKRVGGQLIKKLPKHRYVLFLGNKREKRDMRKNLKWPVLPYPKGTNIKYDTSFTPKIKRRTIGES